MKTVLITGGSGYIGSTITLMLLKRGYRVLNLDIAMPPTEFGSYNNYHWLQWDMTMDITKSATALMQIARGDSMEALIHMAAWKDLPGSYDNPSEYYKNNLVSTINAATLAGMLSCKSIIFSSSAGVYSDDLIGAVFEDAPTDCTSPYGYSKLVGEKIITDIAKQYRMNSYCLRYYNPIGTYEGISVDSSDSMFGNILNQLNGKLSEFTIFGNDWDTADGTAIRDYIDIRDVARAHIHFIELNCRTQVNDVINIGTGVGVSCLMACDIVKTLKPNFKYKFGPRREGDAVGNYAGVTKAEGYGWKAKYTLLDSIGNLFAFASESE